MTDNKGIIEIDGETFPVKFNEWEIQTEHPFGGLDITRFFAKGYILPNLQRERRITRAEAQARRNAREEAKKVLNAVYGKAAADTYGIKQVLFRNPATIVLWNDGTKTVVKAQEGDTYSKEIGLAMAICKKVMGNKSSYNDVFKRWIKDENNV